MASILTQNRKMELIVAADSARRRLLRCGNVGDESVKAVTASKQATSSATTLLRLLLRVAAAAHGRCFSFHGCIPVDPSTGRDLSLTQPLTQTWRGRGSVPPMIRGAR